MHIYFSGIGGSGISALANLAVDLGFMVSGSDIQKNKNTEELQKRGVQIFIGQKGNEIKFRHKRDPIFWLVYSSSLSENHPEIIFAKENNIKISKRDIFINFILKKERLKLICVAGTHGKTTTTAMLSWIFHKLDIPVSHIIGTNLSWANSGQFQPKSKFLIIEADEYDKNFLAYNPYAALLTTVSYDHPDTYKTEIDYLNAFQEFAFKANLLVAFDEDLEKLDIDIWQDENELNTPEIWHLKKTFARKIADYNSIGLAGLHNRQNAALAKTLIMQILSDQLTKIEIRDLENLLSTFPGTERRMEKLNVNLYTDYAHHPEEIIATLEMCLELNSATVIVYQPHQNLRQHLIKDLYSNAFLGAKKVYWLPTYLTREDPNLEVLKPEKLIENIENREIIEAVKMDSRLENNIKKHIKNNDLVVCMGAGNIDDWVRGLTLF